MELINEQQREELPQKIRDHADWQIWGSCWWRVHNGTNMTTIVHCGERGGGKSYNQLELADLLDRTEDDKPRFDLKNMCFEPLKFKERLNATYPRGTVICLDDAGISMYSKESLARVVVELGKTLQTIRRKYPVVQLSLPFFNILEKHARMFSDVYVEVMGRDTSYNENIVKIHTLEKNYYTGDIYRYGVPRPFKKIDPEFGLEITSVVPDLHRIGKPRVKLYHQYDKMKMERQDIWDEQSYDRIASYDAKERAAKEPRVSFKDLLAYGKENRENLFIKGKVDAGKIMAVFDGEHKPTCSRASAYEVARILNAGATTG